MTSPPPALAIEVGDRFGPDVMEGLRLYNRLNEDPRPEPEVENEWPRWFRENPFGPGLFAVARAGGRVVGFNSFIAAEMRLGGRAIPGGKGEFFAVEPEFRRAVDPKTQTPLPVALLSQQLRRTREFGMKAVFAIPNPAAALVNLLAGAKPLNMEFREYVTFFRRPRKALHPHPLKNLVLGWGAVVCTSVPRAAGRPLALRGVTVHSFGSFEEVPLPSPDGVNLLLDETPRMLDHRFSGIRNWKVLLREPGRPPAAFVFTRFPDDLRLAWWSTLEVPRGGLAVLLWHAARRARRDGASNLRVRLPGGAAPPGYLGPWGFVGRSQRQTAFLYSSDPELLAARDALPWRFTNAHMGYY